MADAVTAPVNGQPADLRLQKLLLRKQKVEARQAIAEALAAERKASIPELPAITPPAETFDAGDSGSPVAELNAYAEVEAAATQIVQEIRAEIGDELQGAHILLSRDLEFAKAHGAYATFVSLLGTMDSAIKAAQSEFNPATTDGEEPAPTVADETSTEVMAAALDPVSAAVTLGVSALPSLLALARSNVTIRGRTFTIGQNAVFAALSNQLRNADAHVSLPGFSPVPLNDIFTRVSSLQEARNDLFSARTERQVSVIDVKTPELALVKERLASLRKKRDEAIAATPPKDTSNLDKSIENLVNEESKNQIEIAGAQLRVDLADDVIEAVDAFLATAHEVPTGASMAPISAAAIYHAFFGGKSMPYVLFAEAVFAGGESQYEERVGADKAQHIGGVALIYMVSNPQGEITASGVVTRVRTTNHQIGRSEFTPDPAALS